jgi:hypothetical protein
MNQPKVPTREELSHYLHHTLGFTKVKTAAPGDLLYAHLVPGTKRLWIPLELLPGDRDIVDRVMRYPRSRVPSPIKMPERYKIRKIGKKVVIVEERPPAKRTPYVSKSLPPRRAPLPPSRPTKEQKEILKEISEEEKQVKKLISSLISKIVSENARERQSAREHQAELNLLERRKTISKNVPKKRVPTRSSYMSMVKHPNILRDISQSLTYQRLRNEGHSDSQARKLIEIFEDEIEYPEPPKRMVENMSGRVRALRTRLAFAPESTRRESVQIPIQLGRKHIPDYKLYEQ